jgi:type IV pilus assembly protein PilW
MSANKQPTRPSRGARGVTLIELMVGMMVGLAVTLVVAQTMSFFEGQKRTTTEGVDAQVNGTLALHTIQRDVQMAGYGLTTSAFGLGCPIKAQHGGVNMTFSLVPVRIGDGAGGAPDTINFMMSNKLFAVPIRIAVDHPKTAANFFVQSALGVTAGDLLIAVPQVIDGNNWCSMLQATQDGVNGNGNGNGQGQNQVLHAAGSGGEWNQPGGQSIFPDAGYSAGSYLLNVGQMIAKTYSINAANALQIVTFNPITAALGPPQELYPHIVQLQAMYGKDTNADGSVDTWDNATPADGDNAGWRQVIAVRMALVARSGNYEKDIVTNAQPLWDVGTAHAVAGSAACGSSECLTLKIDNLPDWQHYRYKVYETVVPLRNMLWTL